MVGKFCPAKLLIAFQKGLLRRVTVIALADNTHRLIGYSTVTELDNTLYGHAIMIQSNRLSADIAK
jgi:hypothetical protein